MVEMLVIVVGRYLGVMGLIYLLVLCGHKKQVSFRQLVFIAYSGLIRGAIAFGLVLKLEDVEEVDVIITTSLTLVVRTLFS